MQLNQDLVTETIARLQLPRLTIDVDGTVIRTGVSTTVAEGPKRDRSPASGPRG